MACQVEWLNPLENDCENANTHTHGGVGTFAKEKKLKLMWINSRKKRRREGVTVSDQMLASAGPVRLVSGSSWARSWSSDRTLHSKSDQTRRAFVRS